MIHKDWHPIYKFLFPIAYIRFLGAVVSENYEQEERRNSGGEGK